MRRLVTLMAALLGASLTLGAAEAVAPRTCRGHDATLVGTVGDDRLVGTAGPDVIVGLDGDDVLVGRGDLDFLCGGPGADRFEADATDYIAAGRGADVVDSGGFARLGRGDDRASGVDEVRGGPGHDRITAEGVAANFFGGPGNDILVGGAEPPEAVGGDYLYGGPGDDVLDGKALLNYIAPGPGRDVVRMGRDRRTWTGELSYAGARGPVKVSLRTGIAYGQGRDVLYGVITAVEASRGDDVLAATAGRQVLLGLAGADRLFGFAGEDELRGGRGIDRADGGRAKTPARPRPRPAARDSDRAEPNRDLACAASQAYNHTHVSTPL